MWDRSRFMELIPFTDLIAALGKVASALKAIVYLPKAERKKYQQTMDETDRLIDATPNMVVIWPGDMLLQDTDEDFLREAARLGNHGEWMQARREFRLIRSLRVALCEPGSWRSKIGAAEMSKP
jgi:hypothetical protein